MVGGQDSPADLEFVYIAMQIVYLMGANATGMHETICVVVGHQIGAGKESEAKRVAELCAM